MAEDEDSKRLRGAVVGTEWLWGGLRSIHSSAATISDGWITQSLTKKELTKQLKDIKRVSTELLKKLQQGGGVNK